MYLRPSRSTRRRRLSGLGDADPVYYTSAPPDPALARRGPSPLNVQPPSGNPLDYASPQSAIAAGLPAAQVNAAWAQQINSFSSVQDAVNAGVPPAVVTDLWQGGAGPAVPRWKQYALPLLGFLVGAALLSRTAKGAS